jgi:hypothetical protein
MKEKLAIDTCANVYSELKRVPLILLEAQRAIDLCETAIASGDEVNNAVWENLLSVTAISQSLKTIAKAAPIACFGPGTKSILEYVGEIRHSNLRFAIELLQAVEPKLGVSQRSTILNALADLQAQEREEWDSNQHSLSVP